MYKHNYQFNMISNNENRWMPYDSCSNCVCFRLTSQIDLKYYDKMISDKGVYDKK